MEKVDNHCHDIAGCGFRFCQAKESLAVFNLPCSIPFSCLGHCLTIPVMLKSQSQCLHSAVLKSNVLLLVTFFSQAYIACLHC